MAAPAPAVLNLAMHGQQHYDDDHGRMERRLRFYAAAYMVLAAYFLLRAGATVAPRGGGGAHYSIANAITGLLLWIAALVLVMLSFVHQRLPTAAVAVARVAQVALEPLFELLN